MVSGSRFFILLVFPWIFEFLDFPANTPKNEIFNWQECALESVLVIIIAVPVMFITARFLSRLHYLEGFLRICAWCKKLENNDEWIPIETYFKEKFETESSHGICGECLTEAQQKIKNEREK